MDDVQRGLVEGEAAVPDADTFAEGWLRSSSAPAVEVLQTLDDVAWS